MRTLKFVKNDGAIQFDVDVPRDANIPGEKKPPASTQQQQQQQTTLDPQQQAGAAGRAAPAGPNKTLTFEYDLSAAKLALLDERPPRKPRWASVSPDDKVVVFARNHNLYMMDAANYAKALKKADDTSIVETQLTTDGSEDSATPAASTIRTASRSSESRSSSASRRASKSKRRTRMLAWRPS